MIARPSAAHSAASVRTLGSAASAAGYAARARKNATAMSTSAPSAIGRRWTPTEIPNSQ